MACVVVVSLMRTLELEFLQPLPRPFLQQNQLIPCNKHLVLSLHKKLGSLMELFDESRMDIGVEAIKELETKLRDVAFRVEDEIEFQIAHLHETEEEFGIGTPEAGDTDTPCFKLGLILQQGMEDIDAVKEELVKIKNEYKLQGTPDVLPISEADSSQPASEMVGRDKEFEIIKEMLIKRSSRLRIVSISGMGGFGKTC
ncbi:PREDICTED: uncharacterized protein LOC109184612 [Ipomoea nil]|uniref:uncharacterized protein LOC109184612 n=1 Tax=Ipomoea nil TaxID=35883 RepID=UPI000901BDA7|nr:PREDICTED: uncharacterized protein LOC109184612 [Ipomoea nil]